MARRTVIVRSIPGPNADTDRRPVLGKIVDLGGGSYLATTPAVEGMVRTPQQFQRYYMGYSNGYTEWLPDVALEHPELWERLLAKLSNRRFKNPGELEAAFRRAYAGIFG